MSAKVYPYNLHNNNIYRYGTLIYKSPIAIQDIVVFFDDIQDLIHMEYGVGNWEVLLFNRHTKKIRISR